ncbi:MAG: PBP1A family penicillin-binding protein [Acidobacteriota bacterium]|nr:PBP1A family penicillin-binding protein [Acidobacteriota bacterium]
MSPITLRSWPLMLRVVVAVFAAATAVFAWGFYTLVSGMPGREELRAFSVMPSATVLYDAADRATFTIAKEHRIEVPLAQVSPYLIKAVIAIEDRRFFDHDGLDPIRIAGAAFAVIRAGEAVQGGSTITQQLARQSVGRQKTLRRKLREVVFAAQLERHFTKNEILELYLNKVYFGDGLYGVEAASRGYFNKPAAALTLPEAALLAGLLKAPSNYAPTVDLAKAENRQEVVLGAMLASKTITATEHAQAMRAQVTIEDGLRGPEPFGHYFKEEVRRQLVERFGWPLVSEGGLHVYTTIDPAMQRAADAEVTRSLADIDRTRKGAAGGPVLQAALIAIEPQSGAVRALVGGRDFVASSYDRALVARRQPGSAFKPFIYAAAVEAGYGPNDTIEDLSGPVIANASWDPADEHQEDDWVTLRDGLRLSSNRAAVRLLSDVGLTRTLKLARGFGFTDLPNVPSVALGAGEVTLLGLTSAYSAFANGGAITPPSLIRKVVDADGVVLFESAETPRQAIKPMTAYLMADMLRGVIDAGTGSGARRHGFALPAGGKTGTTNDYKDAWFVGFTPSIVTGVWVGFDQPRTIRSNGYASELAVPMWSRFMKTATNGHKATWVKRPAGASRDVRLARAEPKQDAEPVLQTDAEADERGELQENPKKKRGFWGRLFGRGDKDKK